MKELYFSHNHNMRKMVLKVVFTAILMFIYLSIFSKLFCRPTTSASIGGGGSQWYYVDLLGATIA